MEIEIKMIKAKLRKFFNFKPSNPNTDINFKLSRLNKRRTHPQWRTEDTCITFETRTVPIQLYLHILIGFVKIDYLFVKNVDPHNI